MNEILNEVFTLKDQIKKCLYRNVKREKHIEKYIQQLIKVHRNTISIEDKAVLKETIDFFERELESLHSMSYDSREMLEQINLLKECVESLYMEDTKNAMNILAVQEEERKRVARELHDSTVQSLSSLIYKAEFCSKVIDSDIVKAKLELQIVIKSLREIISEMRNTIYNLRPTVVQDDDLDMLIKKHINHINTENEKISFTYNKEGRLRKIKPICCLTIFRVIQEACQNATKYSEALIVNIEVVYGDKGLSISVTDNGKGFVIEDNLQSKVEEKHFGISIMRERVKLLRGDFEIESQLNIGTRITIHVENVYSDEGEDNVSN